MTPDGHALTPAAFKPDKPLHIHEQSDGRRNQTLAIFVHGLNGTGYGTWGLFPGLLLQQESLGSDVGVFQYETGFKRLRRLKSTSLADSGHLLASELRRTRYESVILIGHSMGGLVIRQAIQYLHQLEGPDFPTLQRLAGVLYCASPLSGSTKVPRLAPYASQDAAFLKVHSSYVKDLTVFFNTYIDESADAEPQGKRLAIPAFSARATGDFWVDEVSATGKLPAEQVEPIGATHSSLVKPEDQDSRIIQWAIQNIKRLQRSHSARILAIVSDPPAPSIITEFTADDYRTDWASAFLSALRAMTSARTDIQFVDRRRADASMTTDLIINVFHSSQLESGACLPRIEETHRRQVANPHLAVGLSAFGTDDHAGVAVAIERQIGRFPPGSARWIAASKGVGELRGQLAEWLTLLVDALDVRRPTDRAIVARLLAEEPTEYFRLGFDPYGLGD